TESTADAEQEAKKAEAEYERSWAQTDANALDRLLADDFILTNSDGSFNTKAQILADIRSGAWKFEYGRGEEMKVRLYSNTAVFNGIWVSKGAYKGKEFNDRSRATTVYVKKNGSWQVVADHISNITLPKP